MYSKIGYDAEATSHSKTVTEKKQERKRERKLLIHGREYYGPFASVSYLCMKRERERGTHAHPALQGTERYCRSQKTALFNMESPAVYPHLQSE
jgi:hypothetical protein